MRQPIASARPVFAFAAMRLGLALGSLAITATLGFPYADSLALVLGLVAVPWAAGLLLLARREPGLALSPLVAVGDIAVLIAVELVAPETMGAIRPAALFFIAVHAHFQGELRGLAIAVAGAAALVLATALRGGAPVHGNMLAFYEASFGAAAVGTAVLVGRLRSTESAGRLRARDLTRRTIAGEREVRRRVAEAIHDGPVQELIGLDMVLSAAGQAAARGEETRARQLIGDARELAARNIQALRDEIVDLGPYAFEELTFESAVEKCLPVWQRRYGLEARLQVEQLDLAPEMTADLFYIAQEAVANAGRHAQARSISIDLRRAEGNVELRVMDDGEGFSGDADPFGVPEPGHLGLASMRERTEMLEGELAIESSERGTKVLVRAPLRPRAQA